MGRAQGRPWRTLPGGLGEGLHPKRLGGLGIPNLRLMNLALRARWLWLSRVDSSKPWSEFNIQVPRVVRQLFEAATTSIVGDGSSTFFWVDRWLPEGHVKDLAPKGAQAGPCLLPCQ